MDTQIPPPSEVVKEEPSPANVDADVKLEETENESAMAVPEQLTTTSRIAVPPKKKIKTSRSSTPNLGGDVEPMNTSSSEAKPPLFPAELNEADVVGGAELRKWFNTEITYELIAALKEISKVRPDNPLRWLGQRLIERADEKTDLQS